MLLRASTSRGDSLLNEEEGLGKLKRPQRKTYRILKYRHQSSNATTVFSFATPHPTVLHKNMNSFL